MSDDKQFDKDCLIQLLKRLDERAMYCRSVQSENEDKGLLQTADIYRVMANCHESDADFLRKAMESLSSASGHITELPAEFAALAEFYQVDDMPALIRIQAEHIERLQKKLPPLRGPESDPQNYRQG